ncbi:hypothetical protein ON010_g3354 [Phytophthora cinnamomi]|nr:hypothetical protein ON010_g3354 [Phytophthora cinnamomi]
MSPHQHSATLASSVLPDRNDLRNERNVHCADRGGGRQRKEGHHINDSRQLQHQPFRLEELGNKPHREAPKEAQQSHVAQHKSTVPRIHPEFVLQQHGEQRLRRLGLVDDAAEAQQLRPRVVQQELPVHVAVLLFFFPPISTLRRVDRRHDACCCQRRRVEERHKAVVDAEQRRGQQRRVVEPVGHGAHVAADHRADDEACIGGGVEPADGGGALVGALRVCDGHLDDVERVLEERRRHARQQHDVDVPGQAQQQVAGRRAHEAREQHALAAVVVAQAAHDGGREELDEAVERHEQPEDQRAAVHGLDVLRQRRDDHGHAQHVQERHHVQHAPRQPAAHDDGRCHLCGCQLNCDVSCQLAWADSGS